MVGQLLLKGLLRRACKSFAQKILRNRRDISKIPALLFPDAAEHYGELHEYLTEMTLDTIYTLNINNKGNEGGRVEYVKLMVNDFNEFWQSVQHKCLGK